ncbi:MAG: hypothetical protein ACPGC9_00570 [Cytophagales bacterium]
MKRKTYPCLLLLFLLCCPQPVYALIPHEKRQFDEEQHAIFTEKNQTASYFYDRYIKNVNSNLAIGESYEKNAWGWCIYANLQNMLYGLAQAGVQDIKGYSYPALSGFAREGYASQIKHGPWVEPGNIAYWLLQQPYAAQLDIEIMAISTGETCSWSNTIAGLTTTYPQGNAGQLYAKIKGGWLCIMDDDSYTYEIIGVRGNPKSKNVTYLMLDPHQKPSQNLFWVDEAIITTIRLGQKDCKNMFLFVKPALQENQQYDNKITWTSIEGTHGPVYTAKINERVMARLKPNGKTVYPLLDLQGKGVQLMQGEPETSIVAPKNSNKSDHLPFINVLEKNAAEKRLADYMSKNHGKTDYQKPITRLVKGKFNMAWMAVGGLVALAIGLWVFGMLNWVRPLWDSLIESLGLYRDRILGA